jgi:hypothetical protein
MISGHSPSKWLKGTVKEVIDKQGQFITDLNWPSCRLAVTGMLVRRMLVPVKKYRPMGKA